MNFLLPASSAPRPPVLRRRYFWFLGGFVTVLLLVTSVPEAYFAFRENRARIAELQSAEARLAASRVTSFLEYHERLLTEVDGLPWRSGVLDEADRVAEYERLMKLVPAVMQIVHIDVAGKRAMRISRTDPNLVGTAPTAAALTAAQQARRTGKWYSPTYLREGNVPYVTLALAAGEGRNGASVVQINLRFVTDMVALALAQAVIALKGHALVGVGWGLGMAGFIVVTWLSSDDLFRRIEYGLVASSMVAMVAFAVALRYKLRSGSEPTHASVMEAIIDMPFES